MPIQDSTSYTSSQVEYCPKARSAPTYFELLRAGDAARLVEREARCAAWLIRRAAEDAEPADAAYDAKIAAYHAGTLTTRTAPASATAPIPMRKFGRTIQPRRDPLRDRAFVGEFAALTGRQTGRRGVPSAVSTRSPSSLSSHPHTLTPTSPTSTTTSISTSENPATAAHLSKPAPWRYTDDTTQAQFAFEALQELGPVVGFTAHLGTEINARAYASGQPLAFLRKRLGASVNAALGRKVEFLFTIEETRDRHTGLASLHLHGVIQVDHARRLLAKARIAMRKALGMWEGPAAKNQIRFKLEIDAGWIGYITKETRWAAPGMRTFLATCGSPKAYLPTYAGPAMTMTQTVTGLAKAKHEAARDLVISARQRPAAIEAPPAAPEPLTAARESPRRSYEHSGTDLLDDAPVDHTDINFPVAEPELTNQSQGPPPE